MNCEICHIDPEEITIIPIPRGDGPLDTHACIPCAIKLGKYCEKHSRPHLGFDDGTSACKVCIDEEVSELSPWADHIIDRIEKELPTDQYQRLTSWANMSSGLTMDSPKVCIVRSVVTVGHCTRRGVRNTVDVVVSTKKPDTILPPDF